MNEYRWIILVAMWFCSHIGLWKHKNCIIKVRLWLINEKTCFQRGFKFFYKKTSIKKRMLKWNQKVKLVKKVLEA